LGCRYCSLLSTLNIFERNGWTNSWDAGIFTYHHYHSVTHEVLGIYTGKARVQLGGDSGPVLELEKGDVLVIPAGVAHKNLDDENAVGVVGAYPDGRDYDMNYGKPDERPQADEHIANVPLPETDPVDGPGGELTRRWKMFAVLPHGLQYNAKASSYLFSISYADREVSCYIHRVDDIFDVTIDEQIKARLQLEPDGNLHQLTGTKLPESTLGFIKKMVVE